MRDTFEVQVRVPEPAATVWGRLIDLDSHSAAIPLTRVTPAGESMREGLRFVGETGLGPLHFSDRMVVRRADSPSGDHPGHLVVEKFGPVAGRVEATVEQVPTGTLVIWRQSLRPAWLPPALRPLGAVVARLAYGVGLQRIVR
ncbi:SRPBCC family protein [Tessaracoccus antarcticus]|uniref:SRPBCC family protein n=1 Tax=Tessaracoccus antarcticus TaxID=2479848 RepID=A0A3M0G9T7_9ACTN|nr:SRPBCC family protein [Tessaracoccus antarcticus]RMB58373.1 SRPBCC family protein [Tessaracoccus antarcticus]